MHGFFLGWLCINTRSLLIAVLGHASLSVANNSLSLGKALEFAAAGVPPELGPRTVLLEGGIVEPLAALGPDDVDMLVCGSRGYGQIRRVLLGGLLAADPRRPAAHCRRATGSHRVRGVASCQCGRPGQLRIACRRDSLVISRWLARPFWPPVTLVCHLGAANVPPRTRSGSVPARARCQ